MPTGQLKYMLAASIVIVGGFFLAVILFSFLRIGRNYRRRVHLGKKKKRTEYVDAWATAGKRFKLPATDEPDAEEHPGRPADE